MRRLGVLVLTFSLVMCGAAAAQSHSMGAVAFGHGAGLGTAAGAARTSIGIGTRPPGFFPHHPHYPGRYFGGNYGGYWPVYYGGYIPFDYGYDYDPGYMGYAPGTFQSAPYAYPYPQGYAPPANYYASAPPPPASYPPPPEQSAPVAQAPNRPASSKEAEPSPEPTVLVFRDGHKQEVENYAIMGSTLFVLSGRRARIPIAELDVPETIRQNESRGLEFSIPARTQ